MRALRLVIAFIFAFVSTVLMPLQPATATATITKTVTVHKSDNSLYQGALVSIVYWNESTRSQDIVAPVATNSSGQAQVTFNAGLRVRGLAIEPASADLVNAIYFDDNEFYSNDTDQNFDVRLKPATIAVNIQTPAGSNAGLNYGISYPELGGTDDFYGYRVTLRSGAFGIDLSETLTAGSDYSIDLNSPNDDTEFSKSYGLRVLEVSGSKAHLVYGDTTYNSPVSPTSGVYNLRLKSGNLSGQLQTSSGVNLPLPAGVTAEVAILKSKSNGSVNLATYEDGTRLATNGTFRKSTDGLAAGKYYPVIAIAGSATLPTFVGAPFYINSAGEYSSNGNTFVAPTSFTLNVKLPSTAPNVVVKYARGDGTPEPGGIVAINTIVGGAFPAGYSSNGLASFAFPDGSYILIMNPANTSWRSSQYQVTVAAGVATVRLGNQTLSPTNGVYAFTTSQANLRFSAIDPLDSTKRYTTNLNAQIKDSSGSYLGGTGVVNGLFSMALANGTNYVLTIGLSPFSSYVGLASKNYKVDVVNGIATVKDFVSGTPIAAASDGTFALALATANVFGKVVGPDGKPAGWGAIPGSNNMTNVHVQVERQSGNNWNYYDVQSDANSKGEYYLNIVEAGTYRIKLYPYAINDVATTNTQTFTVTSSPGTFDLGTTTLNSPSLKVIVRAHGSTENLVNTYINLKQGDNWLDGAQTSSNGVAAITVSAAGNYQLIVNPPYDGSAPGTAKKAYNLTITQNTDGSFTPAIQGLTKDNATGAFILELGLPTLSGKVTAPDGVTPLQNSQVVAVNTATGQSMWDFSTNSNALGDWAMALPQGKYKLQAQAPYGNSNYGNGDLSAEVTVDANGVADVANAANFNLAVALPTWSGVIKAPTGDTVLTNARVCLLSGNTWTCANTDSTGHWALSKPAGFTGFDAGSNLEIQENNASSYAPVRANGAAAVSALLGAYNSGNTYSNIVLRVASPNTEITVTGDGAPLANIWVTADRDNEGYLGGAYTNAQGIARLNISSPTTGFRVRAYVENNPVASSSYTTTMKTYSASDVTAGTNGNGIFQSSLALAQPNLRGTLREPGSNNSGALIPNAWIEVFDLGTNAWKGGANTNSQGTFSLNLELPATGTVEYRITANNAWNSTSTFAKKQYKAVVTSGGNITLTDFVSGVSVSPNSSGVYEMTLLAPSVSGSVQLPNGSAVRDSWVVPYLYSDGQGLWDYGVNSKSNGSFGLAMPDGNYSLVADVPWNSTTALAKSAKCDVSVSGGVITNSASCIDASTKAVTLQLRAPNVTGRLVKPGTTTGVGFANINVRVGNWWTWGRSLSDGTFGILIDADAIKAANSNRTTGTEKIHIIVEPPYSDSSIVRWECDSGATKPICSQLTNDFNFASASYGSVSLGDVEFASPNTKIRVLDPSGQPVGAGAWVQISKRVQNGQNYWNQWIGQYANTDADGYASFNIEDPTLQFAVEVNAPWAQRGTYAQSTYVGSGSGLAFADVNQNFTTFKLASPNLKLSIKEALNGGTAASWGWIAVEEIDATTGAWINWVNGTSLDYGGRASLNLEAGKRFKLTIYPGSSKAGTRTTCVVDVSSGRVVSKVVNQCSGGGTIASDSMSLQLDAGNLQGHVYRTGTTTGVFGAIVLAEGTKTVGQNTLTQSETVTTDSTGRYGLQLDTSYTWTIKVFYVNIPGATPQLSSITTGQAVTPGNGSSTTQDFELAG